MIPEKDTQQEDAKLENNNNKSQTEDDKKEESGSRKKTKKQKQKVSYGKKGSKQFFLCFDLFMFKMYKGLGLYIFTLILS